MPHLTLPDKTTLYLKDWGAGKPVILLSGWPLTAVARYMSRHGGKSVIKAALISSVVPCMLKSSDNPQGTEQAVFDDMAQRMREDRPHLFARFFADFFGVDLPSCPVSAELVHGPVAGANAAGLLKGNSS
jgi:non-heme chloroperoxidase